MLADYVTSKGKEMAIVYVSNDHDQKQFAQNIKGLTRRTGSEMTLANSPI